MQWFRSRAKRMSGLAWLALATQFVLSFGHFHPEQFAFAAAEVASAHKASIVAAVAVPDQKSHEDDDAYCGICAVTALANATMLAAVGGLPLPELFHGVLIRNGTRFGSIEIKSVAFQSRAPPEGALS